MGDGGWGQVHCDPQLRVRVPLLPELGREELRGHVQRSGWTRGWAIPRLSAARDAYGRHTERERLVCPREAARPGSGGRQALLLAVLEALHRGGPVLLPRRALHPHFLECEPTLLPPSLPPHFGVWSRGVPKVSEGGIWRVSESTGD